MTPASRRSARSRSSAETMSSSQVAAGVDGSSSPSPRHCASASTVTAVNQQPERARRTRRVTLAPACAYLARSVFCPTALNRTTSLVSSSSASTLITRADAELRVTHPHARAQRHAGRSDPRPRRRRPAALARALAAPAAAVRVGPELVVRKVALVARRRERRRDALDQLGRHFVDEARRLARLVLAEDPPARRAGQHQPLTRARVMPT